MNIPNLIEQGLNLMMLGMGMVFFILSLLVVVLKIVSAILMKYEPEVVPSSANSKQPPKINENVVAAITEAVRRYRS